MIESKRFSGVLNTDDKPENVAGPQHIDAKNIRFYGGPNGMTLENIKGNYVINNANLPAGTNQCIGSFFDSVNQRIIWFNYNSNGDNGIYSLNIKTEQVSPIFICGTDSATNIFNFNLDYPVHSCNIVYREASEGDLLYWTDGYNRPRYLNLSTVSSLAPFTEDMINAAKNAPLAPPSLVYQDDINFKSNNLRKKLFRSCYRWVYSNGEKSTFSPISKLPLPINGYDLTTNSADTYNNLIQITVKGGGDDYTAIEIAGQFNIDNVWGDFFLIDTLNATQYNIAPGGTYNYKFYNNATYTSIDPQETDLYFSWLPDKANTLELLNGNVIIYGGITDGYNRLQRDEVDVVITSSLSSSGGSVPTITYGYSGPRSIYVYVGPVIQTGAVYTVTFNYTYTPPFNTFTSSDTYTTIGGDTQSSIATSLAGLINNPGIITATATGGGYLFITIATGVGSITNVVVTASGTGATATAGPSWKWSCPGRLGLVYFDDRGKTNGVISYVADNVLDNTDFAFYTPPFGTSGSVPQIPIVNASINHTPPTWATSYQWVRANLLPTNFIYWVTNDYQNPGDGYLYFCIQNLIEQGTKDTGFVPSYEFTEGDRVRVIASYTGSGFTPYVDAGGQPFQQDMAILGVVNNRQMTSPATNGTFLKVYNTASFPTAGYQQKMLIEIYTPRARNTDETEFFYEWGEKYDIYTLSGNRYHRGQIADQTSTQPATFEWKEGDVYFKPRTFYTAAGPTATTDTKFFQDANYSDYFISAVNSNGRAWLIDALAKQEYNSVLIRWGGKYQSGTTINELPIFRPNDLDLVDRSKGDIRRFKSRDRILRVFQDRGTGQYGVYMRFIQNNQGQSELVTTNEIITTNNIQYYQGVYGVSGYPTNLVSTQNADYFVDVVTGRAVRLGGDGLTDLGLNYKGQFYLSQLVTPYNRSIFSSSNQVKSKVLALFDYFNNQYHVMLEGGVRSSLYIYQEDNLVSSYDLYLAGEPEPGDVIEVTMTDSLSTTEVFSYTAVAGDTANDVLIALDALINASTDFVSLYTPGTPASSISITSAYPLITVTGSTTIDYALSYSPQNFSFNETRNAFCSFYDFHPEWGTGANDMVYTWKNGDIWKHDSSMYCNFYGTQYNANATFVFNQNLLLKKSWHSINEVASGVWSVPSMYTNVKSYGSTYQSSNLVDAEFTILEGNPSSAIKRDTNSSGGKINGDFMKGNYLVAKFEKQNASNYITLSEVSVRTTESPLTAK